MMGSGFFLAVMAMSIAEVLTTIHKPHVNEYKAIVQSIPYWGIPILVGVFISKKTFELREKKKQSVFQYLKMKFQAIKQRTRQKKHEE